MPQRKKPVPLRKQPGSTAELRQALTRRKKAELVDVLMELAQGDRGILRRLTARFDVATVPDDLVAATRQAIADATDFDERDINHNFDYDDQAYNTVKRNLGCLIDSGDLRLAMSLALELMKRGSYQVEMSDEGLMSEDVEDCLGVVLNALRTCELPGTEVIASSEAMLGNDRIGFIAREPLQSLRNHFQTTAARKQSGRLPAVIKTDSSRSHAAFAERRRKSVGARCPISQPGTGRVTLYTPAEWARFSPRVVAVEATRRSGMEAHSAPLSAGVEEECPLRFTRSLARPSTLSLPRKASETSLQAMVRPGTSSWSKDTGLGTDGTRGAPPRSHRPIQVRRTHAS
jgi:hypothetical protein